MLAAYAALVNGTEFGLAIMEIPSLFNCSLDQSENRVAKETRPCYYPS
jgi:hypothetical protein